MDISYSQLPSTSSSNINKFLSGLQWQDDGDTLKLIYSFPESAAAYGTSYPTLRPVNF